MTTAPPPTGRSSYKWLTVAILAVTGVYTWYVIGQYQRLDELNQHELASAGAELKRTIETSFDSVGLLRPVLQAEDPSTSVKAGQTYRSPALCKFDTDQPYLELDGACSVAFDPGAHPTLQEYLTLAGATLVTSPSLGVVATVQTELDGQPYRKIATAHFRLRIDTLLRELSFPESFELILVSTSNGGTLYLDAPAERRLARRLRWGEQHFRDSTSGSPARVTITNLSDAIGDAATPSWKTLSAASTLTSLELGGVWHRIYLQPLALDRSGAEGLVLVGAVPSSALIREALAVDASFVAVLVFVVLLGILGFPFIKLMSLDRRERFRLIDVARLYLSTAALVALFTLAAFGIEARWRWEAVADDGLATLANQLTRHFMNEVAAIRDDLAAYDAQVATWGPRACDDRWSVQTNWFESGGNTDGHDGGLLTPPTRAVDIEQVAWIRPNGTQVWKATNRSGTKASVPNRPYFTAVRDGNTYLAGKSPIEFFISPDRSISDGKFYTFLSMRSSIAKGFCSDMPGESRFTAVATARLRSLDRTPLPTGYGFALINREGRVLYHSDGRLSLRENFFEQLGHASRLRALVYSNRTETFDTPYRKRSHRIHARPIPLTRTDGTSAGLALATFRDTSIEHDVVARVFLVGLGGPVLFGTLGIGVTMLLLSIVARRTQGQWTAWLWPHGGHTPMYRQLSLVLLLLFGAGLGLSLATMTTAVVVLIPTAAVLGAVAIYMRYAGRPVPRLPLRSAGWHTLMLMLIVACIVVVPGVGFFRMALGHEFGTFVAAEHAWLEDQRRDVDLAVRAEAREDAHSEAVGDRLAKSRAAYLDAAPAPFDRAPDTSSGDAILMATLHGIEGVLPIEDETLPRQRFPSPEDADAPRSTDEPEPVYTPPPTWAGAGIVAVTLGGVVVSLLGWVPWATNRVLLARLGTAEQPTAPRDAFEQLWTECSEDQRCLLLQIRRERLANPYQQAEVATLLERGVLALRPDLRPSSEAFDTFLHEREREYARNLEDWERVDTSHSWRHARMVLVASLGVAAFFLIATQPGLQTGLLGVATGLTGLLTTANRLRDAAWGWITRPKAGGTES